MKSLLFPSLLAASISVILHGSQAFAADTLPVLAETETQVVENADSLLIERAQIKVTPMANTDLSQLLKTQPGIGIDDGTASLRGGDLAPAEISLADARPHQTNYMIGGVTTNNISTFNSSVSSSSLGGHTSGYFFDTGLLESVEVMDSNVDAEYGGFTGGVINVELRKPTDEFSAEYNYRMTDSDWNSDPKLDGDNDEFYLPTYGDGRYQPKYQKRFHNLFIGGAVNEDHKLGLGISVQESDIPQLYLDQWREQHQTNTSVFINHLWQAGTWDISNELRFSEFTAEKFLNDTLNDNVSQPFSDYETNHSGFGVTVKLNRHLGWAQWNNTIAYDRLSDKRTSDAEYFRTNFDFETFDFSTEGSYSNMEQVQHSTKLKSVLEFNPIYSNDLRHQFKVGGEVQLHKTTGRFNENFSSYKHFTHYDKAPEGSDGEFIDGWVQYLAGDYSAEANQFILFVTDKVEWRRLTIDLGLRVEHMELFDETVLAPRLSASWDFETDRINRLTLGTARYYSGSLLGWALTAEKSKLKTTYFDCVSVTGDYSSLNPSDYNCAETMSPETVIHSDTTTPYADEISTRYQLSISNLMMDASYVYRMQRDGISSNVNLDTDQDETINNITSDSHIFSLRFSNERSYSMLGGQLNGYLDLGYVDRTGAGNVGSNYDNSNDLYVGFEDDWLLLDGELTKRSEMDTGSYNSDVTIALAINLSWPQYGLRWSNLINHEGGRNMTIYQGFEDTIIDGEEATVMSVASAKMEALTTWDTKFSWTPSMANEHISLGVSITNLLDTQAQTAIHGYDVGNSAFVYDYYSKGREIWLNVGVRL